jgi:ketosteroid isomerase-like protein
VDAQAAARAWVEAWERAWPVGDVDAVAALYSDDALLRFDADGVVVEQRDVWALGPGRRDLPDWASEGRS